MYVYCENKKPVAWPVYPDHLRHNKPSTSFGDVIAPDVMAAHGYLPFQYTDRPVFDPATNECKEVAPELVGGVYQQAWQIVPLSADVVSAAAAEAAKAAKDIRRQAIFADLATIDTKSIRALREGNATRIAELETQAVALRAELAAL